MKHWKQGKSALELAVSWEAARNNGRGLPPEIASAIDTVVALRGADLLICFPEHQVHLDGGGHPSQNDLWALLRTSTGNASLALEAKAGEPFDNLVKDWLPDGEQNSRKPQRLAALQSILGINGKDVSRIRYQLLHRTASALLEAKRFQAESAILIVQSFKRIEDEESWKDFNTFCQLLDVSPVEGVLHQALVKANIPLYVGWVSSQPADARLLGTAI